MNFRHDETSLVVCPHPIPIPFYFSLAGRFLNLVWAMGRRAGFLKKETAEFKFKMLGAFLHHIILCLV